MLTCRHCKLCARSGIRCSPQQAVRHSRAARKPGGAMTHAEHFSWRPDWAIQTERVIAQVAFGGADIFECDRTSQEDQARRHGKLASRVACARPRTRGSGRPDIAADGCDGHRQAAPVPCRRIIIGTPTSSCPVRDPRKKDRFHPAVRLLQGRDQASFAQDRDRFRSGAVDEVYDGYFCHPVDKGVKKSPTVLMLGGADSLAEELYFWGVSDLAIAASRVLISIRRDADPVCV